MPNESDDIKREEHPWLTPDEERLQRGEKPADAPPDAGRDPSRPFPSGDVTDERREEIWREIEGTLRQGAGRVRQQGLWPYLLIRAFPGDHGVRPFAQPFWESPDILVVPGIVESYDGTSATLRPQVGQPHTLFVHVWNLGRLSAIGVRLRVWWGNPAFSFDDPAHPPTLISQAYFDLPDRMNRNCHQLVRLPTTWTPAWENGGHECLLAKVECFADASGPGFDARMDRHIAQRNLMVVPEGHDLGSLLTQLGQALPQNATVELLHGMQAIQPTLQAHDPWLAATVHIPATLPSLAAALPDGGGYLGAVADAFTANSIFISPSEIQPLIEPVFAQWNADLAAPDLQAPQYAHFVLPQVLETAKQLEMSRGVSQGKALGESTTPINDLLLNAGIADLSTQGIADALQASPGEGHMLRLQASREGRVIGGYTIIVLGSNQAPDAGVVISPAEAITAKAKLLGLGAPHPESPQPWQTPPPRSEGYWQRFDYGWVYWSPAAGAQAVWGAIFAKWAEFGWEQGFLGFPLTDETVTPDGGGRFNHFEGGSIYWTPETGAHEVHGAIRDKWAELGWEQSALGYPTTDELPTVDGQGRYSQFQGGTIVWTPVDGARMKE